MLTNVYFIERLEGSRKYLLKHLKGMSPQQIEFKPYPECKNVKETIQHLIIDDMAALQSLQTGAEPDYESFTVTESDYGKLLSMLDDSHAELVGLLRESCAEAPLDADLCVWGSTMPAAAGISMLSSEDYYHAGQVAFIRMATDPTWDYYAAIYGG